MRSIVDCVIIRWERGLVCWPEGAGGKEKYVEARGITVRDEAVKLAKSLMAAYQTSASTTGISGLVWNASQQPGSFNPGDRLGGLRVQSIAITMDEDGETVVTPALGDPLEIALKAMDRKIQRTAAPVTSEWASPFPPDGPRAQPIDSTPPDATWRGQRRKPTGSAGST